MEEFYYNPYRNDNTILYHVNSDFINQNNNSEFFLHDDPAVLRGQTHLTANTYDLLANTSGKNKFDLLSGADMYTSSIDGPLDILATEKLPLDSETTKNLPLDILATENLPLDILATDNLPLDSEITDTLPLDILATDNLPLDILATDNLPLDILAMDNLPLDILATDNLPLDSEITDTLLLDILAMDNLPLDILATDNLPLDSETTKNLPLDILGTDNHWCVVEAVSRASEVKREHLMLLHDQEEFVQELGTINLDDLPDDQIDFSTPTTSTNSSPGSTISSPARTISSPARTISSPGSTISSPARTISSPGSTISSPARTISSPGSTISSPGSTISSPARTISSPGSTISSPGSTISSPGRTFFAQNDQQQHHSCTHDNDVETCTPTRRPNRSTLIEKQKTSKLRDLNNMASRQYRQRRRHRLVEIETQMHILEKKNTALRAIVAKLERQRERMKKAISGSLRVKGGTRTSKL
ncbi:putative Basic region leucine zipper-containing protein 3 [Homarus americanus]|uniref:Putative Basic region leucine zipper-containing protein 3 n=2 Tax=Homarus americanus TaxID=6706 RepID=A0A8J5ND07_HOMAM|nr:putative Basic region leucine zipper-containing protein 3 [Homarus americanus]